MAYRDAASAPTRGCPACSGRYPAALRHPRDARLHGAQRSPGVLPVGSLENGVAGFFIANTYQWTRPLYEVVCSRCTRPSRDHHQVALAEAGASTSGAWQATPGSSRPGAQRAAGPRWSAPDTQGMYRTLRRLRAPVLRDVARCAGHRHRHPQQGLDARHGGRLHAHNSGLGTQCNAEVDPLHRLAARRRRTRSARSRSANSRLAGELGDRFGIAVPRRQRCPAPSRWMCWRRCRGVDGAAEVGTGTGHEALGRWQRDATGRPCPPPGSKRVGRGRHSHLCPALCPVPRASCLPPIAPMTTASSPWLSVREAFGARPGSRHPEGLGPHPARQQGGALLHQPTRVVLRADQVVAPPTCPTTPTACSNHRRRLLVVEGEVVPSQGRARASRSAPERIEVVGLVDDPDTYPIQPKQHSFEYRAVAAAPRTNTFGAVARVGHTLDGGAGFFDCAGSTGAHAHHHRQRLRGGADVRVSTLDAEHHAHPTARWTSRRLLRARPT